MRISDWSSDVCSSDLFAWIVRGDRGITWARNPLESGSRVVAGEWWAPDYAGPPRVSFDAEAAQAFGLEIGDTIAVNVLGREITATEIGRASCRERVCQYV